MKIKNKILKEFIKQSSLTKGFEITEVIINFSEEGMKVYKASADTTILVDAVLKKEAFNEYEPFGEIGVLNYRELLNILNNFGEDIIIEKNDTELIFKGGKTIRVPLAEPSLIERTREAPNLEFDKKVVLKKEFFNSLLKNIDFSLTNSDVRSVNLVFSNNKFGIKYGTRYKFEEDYNIELEISESVSIKFGDNLFGVITDLEGDFELLFKEKNYPIKIIKDDGNYNIKYLLAPRVVNNE